MKLHPEIIESFKTAIDAFVKVKVTGSNGQSLVVYPYYLWLSKTENPILLLRCFPENSHWFEDLDLREVTEVLVSEEKVEYNISAPSVHYSEDICEIIYPKY